MNEGFLIAVCGPSGVGKGTINSLLLKRNPNLKMSISATTRAPRINETDGKEYYFVDPAEFESLIATGQLLEWAVVHDTYYGTPLVPVQEMLAAGYDVLLEIDVQGALQVKSNFPNAILIFLTAPNLRELERRLRDRGTETEAQIARRQKTTAWEMTMIDKFDYVIMNEVVEDTYQAVLNAIITAKEKYSQNPGGQQNC